jgi:hypothetical protein
MPCGHYVPLPLSVLASSSHSFLLAPRVIGMSLIFGTKVQMCFVEPVGE